ncbi:MAG: mechanosensitive ion channel family protein, partial [Actinobacteria bacterium]|nr:mechanosensitive ion channel family protein [Actinomycetota bacterium]
MQDGIPVEASSPAQPPCAAADGSLCQQMYELTHVDWLSRYADSVVDGTFSILTIMVLAFGLRLVVHRAINRLISRVSEGRTPAWPRTRERQAAGGPRPESTERRSQRARTIGSLLRSVSSFMIYGIAFIMVLAEFGVDVAPILASAGVLGLAIGFGAQNLVRDFLSGIFMMLEDQYGVGDTVDLGEATGDVEAVGLRITTIRDVSGTVWYVRNGEILRVGNFS